MRSKMKLNRSKQFSTISSVTLQSLFIVNKHSEACLEALEWWQEVSRLRRCHHQASSRQLSSLRFHCRSFQSQAIDPSTDSLCTRCSSKLNDCHSRRYRAIVWWKICLSRYQTMSCVTAQQCFYWFSTKFPSVANDDIESPTTLLTSILRWLPSTQKKRMKKQI